MSDRPIKEAGQGRKDDQAKIRMSLIPPEPILEVGRVLTFGAIKYAPDNWQRVPHARERYADATLRHFFAWSAGEARDVETGYHHLAHAVCCLLFILWFELRGESDDPGCD